MEGYFFVAIGKRYIDECYNLSLTIRKHGDKRPISLLINEGDEEYALSKNIFDKLIYFNPNDKLFNDCETSFEKYCLYPRINFDKYLPYDKNIITDSDMLCIHNMDKVWQTFNENEQPVQMIGFKNDLTWHWGTLKDVIEAYGKHVPHTHGGIFYIKKSEKLKDFFSYCREIFYKYEDYKCKKYFRGGKVDEIIFAIAFSKFDYEPLEFTDYSIMTFNIPGTAKIPTKIQTANNIYKIMDDPIPLVHMFEKMEGENYKKLFERIMENEKKQNFCIHIYTTHKNHDRCKLIEETWGKHIDNLFFYTDRKIEKDNYIYCTDDDTYNSHMYKNFFALKYSYENFSNIDWHLFIGDDNFVYHYNLEKLLEKLDNKENAIFGELIKPGVGWKNLAYIGGGGGLLLNKVSLKEILEKDHMTYEEKMKCEYSDAVIGLICEKNNIKLSPQPGFYTHAPWNYGINNPEEYITFHYIKNKDHFYYLYNKYKIK